MNTTPDRLEGLKQKFPKVFNNANLPFGLECSAGWDPLLTMLCEYIDHVLREAPQASFQIRQIKEKFGALRFYYTVSGLDDARAKVLRELVSRAESSSTRVCEDCGKSGHPRKDAWILTLCDACAQARGCD